MQINRITTSNRQNFSSLYYGYTIQEKFRLKHSRRFFSNLTNVINKIIQNNFDKKKNVDIILNTDGDVFFGVIYSKKQGTPMNPGYKCNISPSPKADLKEFEEWINTWDKAYADV